jgi:hypothetical protein
MNPITIQRKDSGITKREKFQFSGNLQEINNKYIILLSSLINKKMLVLVASSSISFARDLQILISLIRYSQQQIAANIQSLFVDEDIFFIIKTIYFFMNQAI